jgi:hypothetical protein
MLCYRDRTYCINKECSKPCSKRLTEEIEKEAAEWGLPVMISCYICTDVGEDETVSEM